MMYADYDFYEKNFSCEISEDNYITFFKKASRQMDYYTFGRLKRLEEKDIPDEVKLCQCEIAEYLYWLDVQAKNGKGINGKGAIKSETVEDYRVEYGSDLLPVQYKDSGGVSGTQKTILGICQKYLTRPINYMYTGVDL